MGIQQNLIGEKAFRTSVIRSISFNQDEILTWILKLHCKTDTFDLDPTFGNGMFYVNIPTPRYIYDIEPRRDCVDEYDSTDLKQFKNNSLNNICFDPPFCFGIHGKAKENISSKRFTIFKDFNELKYMYRGSLKEFYRILKSKGILVFKCQDYTDSKTTMTHCLVYNWATEIGFYAKDLFILCNNSRIDNPKLNQRHSRKCHSYFWVFKKG